MAYFHKEVWNQYWGMFTSLLQAVELVVLLYRPVFTLRDFAVFAYEHLGCLLITFQLPIQPSQSNNGELATMRLTVSAAMTYGEVGGTSWHVVDAMEVVHTVLVCYVSLAAKEIHDGRMYFL